MRRVVRLGRQRRDVTADHLIGRVAEDWYRGRVERLDGAPLVDDHHGVDCGFHDRPAPRFAFRSARAASTLAASSWMMRPSLESIPQGRDLGGTDSHLPSGPARLPACHRRAVSTRVATGFWMERRPPHHAASGAGTTEQTEGTHHRLTGRSQGDLLVHPDGDEQARRRPERHISENPVRTRRTRQSGDARSLGPDEAVEPFRQLLANQSRRIRFPATMVPSRSATMTLASGRSGLRPGKSSTMRHQGRPQQLLPSSPKCPGRPRRTAVWVGHRVWTGCIRRPRSGRYRCSRQYFLS